MTKLNHNRDLLRYIDNCLREMEIDARRYAPPSVKTIERPAANTPQITQAITAKSKQSRPAFRWVSRDEAESRGKIASTALSTRKAFSKFQRRVGTLGPRADEDIHIFACAVMLHVMTHRNTGLITQLICAMPKSSRRKGLVDWFERHMPLRIAYATGKVLGFPKQTSDEWKQFVAEFETTLEEAISAPFWVEQEKLVARNRDTVLSRRSVGRVGEA